MTLAAPGDPTRSAGAPTGALPQPIPWLGRPGPVPMLDSSESLRIPAKSVVLRPQVPDSEPSAHTSLRPVESPHPVESVRPVESPHPVESPCSVERVTANTAQTTGAVSIRPALATRVSLVQRIRGWLPKKKRRSGSGIPARKMIQVLVWVRRFAQVGFFALFFYLLAQTAFRGTFSAHSDEPVRLPLPVEGFLLADPFVAAMTL